MFRLRGAPRANQECRLPTRLRRGALRVQPLGLLRRDAVHHAFHRVSSARLLRIFPIFYTVESARILSANSRPLCGLALRPVALRTDSR